MKLVIVDHETENIGHSFGIPDDRQDELRGRVAEVTRKALFEPDYDQRDAAQEIAEYCNDIQEYTVCLMWFIPGFREIHKRMGEVFSGLFEK